eukprot:1938095-Heterocapsa_arctica.AAC.1
MVGHRQAGCSIDERKCGGTCAVRRRRRIGFDVLKRGQLCTTHSRLRTRAFAPSPNLFTRTMSLAAMMPSAVAR